jgi:HSP20 family molecular chaperone IbpA
MTRPRSFLNDLLAVIDDIERGGDRTPKERRAVTRPLPCDGMWTRHTSGPEQFTTEIDLPGHALEDITVSVTEKIVTVTVKDRHERPNRQRLGGTARLRLPASSDPSTLQSTLSNGVLHLLVAPAKNATPRTVTVQTS